MMHPTPVRVLLLEDNPTDARLVVELLDEENRANNQAMRSPFEVESVDRLATALDRLAQQAWDVLLLDLSLPDSEGFDTFERVHSRAPSIPILLLTGFQDEALGYQAIQAGAQDYLLKGQISGPLLARAIRYAIERSRLVTELRAAMASLKTLSGLLPICAWCKSIRNDSGYWQSVEGYIQQHSDAQFSHGLCPECAVKHYPEYASRCVEG